MRSERRRAGGWQFSHAEAFTWSLGSTCLCGRQEAREEVAGDLCAELKQLWRVGLAPECRVRQDLLKHSQDGELHSSARNKISGFQATHTGERGTKGEADRRMLPTGGCQERKVSCLSGGW